MPKVKRLMTKEDGLFALTLQDLLDKESITYEEKLAIIKWFESFDYLNGDETYVDLVLRYASKLDW